MRTIPAIVLAATIGLAIELALGVISVVSVLSSFGPCGPTGNAPAFVSVIHQPGFWLAGLLMGDSSPLYLPLAVAVTTVLLSILAFIALRLIVGRNDSPSTSGAPGNLKSGDESKSGGGRGSTPGR